MKIEQAKITQQTASRLSRVGVGGIGLVIGVVANIFSFVRLGWCDGKGGKAFDIIYNGGFSV